MGNKGPNIAREGLCQTEVNTATARDARMLTMHDGRAQRKHIPAARPNKSIQVTICTIGK